MNSRIQELIGLTKTKFGLSQYDLKRHRLSRNVNIFGETSYLLCMEWFPNHEVEEEDESNPDGTAVIEINVNARQFMSAIFVMGITYAENGITFENQDVKTIISWIENETGLTYGKQFHLHRKVEGELQFKECFEDAAVSPSGHIEVKYNQEGKLISFFVHGQFPSKDRVREETFILSLEKVKPLALNQLKLVEFPSFEQNKLVPVYSLEEIFVTNDGTTTIPFELIADVRSYLKVDEIISWNDPIHKTFERTEINWVEEVTEEQAFSCEPSPDSFPITTEERTKCMLAVKEFLQQEYPNDTGKWILSSLHREKGYIHAIVRVNHQDTLVFRRKLMLIIDSSNLQVVNYMDNKTMLEMYNSFQSSDKVTITKEEAFENIKEKIELKPIYVFDFELRKYVLCGKLDCHHGVHAASGEVISLDDL